MATSFSALKKNRSSSFDELNNQIQEMGSGGFKKDDDNQWKLSVDKAGNGFAVIRFLPAPPEEDLAFVKVFDHGFQGSGGWYIENSLTTLGKDDPLSEYNSLLWNNGTDAGKEQARDQKRRLNYHANIYVVKDPANPDNEGKVFLYKFGKKIFDKLNNAMNPEFEDEKSLNPFDFWDGANFKLKARKGDGGYRTYEPSSFDAPGPVTDPTGTELTDEQMEEMWKTQHSLQDIVDPKNFKSYAELKAKLHKVLRLDGGAAQSDMTAENDGPSEMEFKPKFEERSEPTTSEKSQPASDDDEDDSMAFFKSLANDD